MNTEAISVLLYEDNDALRSSISQFLQCNESVLLLGSFPNALHLEDQLSAYRPQVVLMDIGLPGISGIEATRRIAKAYPDVCVLMLTVFEDSDRVLEAVRAGASGYLLKKHIPDRLIPAIGEVIGGGAPMSPAVARSVVSSLQERKPGTSQYHLTPRELEIVRLLAAGNSYKQTADCQHVSIDTVRSQIKSIYRKLHVHSQTEAVAKALKDGLL